MTWRAPLPAAPVGAVLGAAAATSAGPRVPLRLETLPATWRRAPG
jgi:hypothetical protein